MSRLTRSLAGFAGVAMLGGATLAALGVPAGAGTIDFKQVPCVAQLGNGIDVPRDLSATMNSPTEANAGTNVTFTLPGGDTKLPSTNDSPPLTITAYKDLSTTYKITGGTIVAGSGSSGGQQPTINGDPTTGTIDISGNTITIGTPGPIPPGTLHSPNVTFKVHAGAAGTTIKGSVVESNTTANIGVFIPVHCPYPDNTLTTTQVVMPPGADAPNAVADTATTDEGTAVTVDVLKNDTANKSFPIDQDSLTVTSDPAHGKTTVNADHTITYTPAAGFSGTDSFEYQLCSKLPAPTTTTSTSTPEVPQAVRKAAATTEPTAVFCDKATVTITVLAASSPATEGTTVAPATTTAQLPRTGSSSAPLALMGFGLLVAGLAATGFARSRRRSDAN